MGEPCIISVAVTGSVPRKADNPAVPIHVAEQIESTHQAYEAGASLVHIHVRNDDETPSSDPDRFAAVQDGVRQHCPGMIVQFSTGGRGRDPAARGLALVHRPDMASLSTGSVNFPTIVYENPAALVTDLTRGLDGAHLARTRDAAGSDRGPPGWYWQVRSGHTVLRSTSLAGETLTLPARYEPSDEGGPSPADGTGPRGEALILRETARFLTGMTEVLEQHSTDIAAGILAAVEYVLAEAEASPLLRGILTSARAGDDELLPLLTTRSAPVLGAAT